MCIEQREVTINITKQHKECYSIKNMLQKNEQPFPVRRLYSV